jgi:phospholipid/cholesterol/gamma-HCH transport system permease protein
MISTLTRSVGSVGHGIRVASRRPVRRLAFLGAVLRATVSAPPGAHAVAGRIFVQQVRFTFLQAVPLVIAIGMVLGLTIILAAYSHAARFGVSELTTPLLVSAVIRELGPLLTAMLVVGRSGTAIAAELATNDVLGEIEAVDALGVSPIHYFAVPRIHAMAVSVVLLMICLQATAMLSGMLAASVIGSVALADSLASLHLTLQPADVYVSVLKGLIFGGAIGVLCTFEGLMAGGQPTALPQAVSRAVVASFLFVFTATAIFSLLVFR